ncbi:MAG: hypothetical protein LN588_05520 [Rickettsia endosymbiont of Bryobia graminum]|nr:hypothetical protein [Rickettsia endosymbiont of Bryobia graminum]
MSKKSSLKKTPFATEELKGAIDFFSHASVVYACSAAHAIKSNNDILN